MSYFRLVTSRAYVETKVYWNVHQIWKYAATPISAMVLRLLVKRWSPVMGWEGFLKEALVFTVCGFIVSWVGSYLINLIRVPAILHHEQNQTISGLEGEKVRLASEVKSLREQSKEPLLSSLQKTQDELIQKETAGYSQEEMSFLRTMVTYGGEIKDHELPNFSARLSVPVSAIQKYLATYCRSMVVKQRFDPPHQGRVWFVVPELKSSLERHFARF